MSYWSLLPAAAGFLTTALTKPKKQTYSSEYMDRYLANLRGEKVSGDVRRLSMMGDIKAIGKSTGKALRQIRAEETDPGIRTSAIVDLYKGEGELLGEASQRANILQAQESARISERQSTAEMYQARVKDEIARANEIAEEEWQSRMMAGGVGLAASGVAMFGEQALQQKALLEGQQQDIAYIKSLGIDPESMTSEGIAHMVEQGTITAEQGQSLITRKPEVERGMGRILTEEERISGGFDPAPEGYQYKRSPTGEISLIGKTPPPEEIDKPTFVTKTISDTMKQKMQYNPKTNEYDIPFGEPELITTAGAKQWSEAEQITVRAGESIFGVTVEDEEQLGHLERALEIQKIWKDYRFDEKGRLRYIPKGKTESDPIKEGTEEFKKYVKDMEILRNYLKNIEGLQQMGAGDTWGWY